MPLRPLTAAAFALLATVASASPLAAPAQPPANTTTDIAFAAAETEDDVSAYYSEPVCEVVMKRLWDGERYRVRRVQECR